MPNESGARRRGARRRSVEADLYPDARPCLAALRDMGLWVGIAGNQTARAGAILRGLNLPADLIGTSEDWRAAKPDAAFFEAVAAVAPCPAGQIVYVRDRLDNDLKPAKAAGMRTVFIRRGPWGYAWEHHPDHSDAADWQVTSLAETAAPTGACQPVTWRQRPGADSSPGTATATPSGVPRGSGWSEPGSSSRSGSSSPCRPRFDRGFRRWWRRTPPGRERRSWLAAGS
jgi:hypothetical protein